MFEENFDKSHHAAIRGQQRSIPDMAIDALRAYGKREAAPHGAVRLSFDKKGWDRLLKYFGAWQPNKLGQLRKTEIIETTEGKIITVQFRR